MKRFHFRKTLPEATQPRGKEDIVEKERLYDLLIHDLAGPLAVAATSTGNLLHKAEQYGPLTDYQKHVIERILRNVHKAQTLVQEMLELSRSEEGLFQREHFSVQKLLRDSLVDVLETIAPQLVEELSMVKNEEALRDLLAAHGIFLEIHGKYSQAPFCHDPKKVQQIFRNLMSNALKYRRQRMAVSIQGETDLFISVEDDGLGIPLEEQEAIFKRFVRLKNEKRVDVPGVGLGLPGVKALVEAMKGEITLKSIEESGTCFTVRIPPLHSH